MSFVCSLTEADAAHIEIAHVATLTTALETAAYDTALELWRTACAQEY